MVEQSVGANTPNCVLASARLPCPSSRRAAVEMGLPLALPPCRPSILLFGGLLCELPGSNSARFTLGAPAYYVNSFSAVSLREAAPLSVCYGGSTSLNGGGLDWLAAGAEVPLASCQRATVGSVGAWPLASNHSEGFRGQALTGTRLRA